MSSPAQPQGCTHLKLNQLSRRVARLYDHEHRALGLKNSQYALLSHIVLLGPLTQAELAARLALQPSTLTRNLQPLLAKGWVVVGPGADARSHAVQATDEGRAVRQQGLLAWKRAQLALNARLGEARVARLHALLQECVALLDDGGELAAEGADTGAGDTLP